MRLPESLRSPLVAAAAATAIAIASPAQAQCFGPDGLTSPACCGPVALNLPDLGPISMPGQGDVWDSCSLADQAFRIIETSPPNPTDICGQFEADIRIFNSSGDPLMEGRLILDYTRTFDEQTSVSELQVWRFAAKAEFELAGGSLTPGAQVPNSLLSGVPAAFYYGYVDYALDCGTGAMENSLVLYHGCDLFQHMPTFSAFPGVFDPETSYAIVGPDTISNPFFPSLAPLNSGDLVAEGIRSVGPVCLAEDALAQGTYERIIDACMCPLSLANPQMTLGRFQATGFCGNTLRSLDVFPTLPYLHTVTTALGRWSTDANYPGPESAGVLEGIFQHVDACTTSGSEISFDINYGGVTRGGYPAFGASFTPNNSTFIDMASNFSWVLGTPLPLPLVGEIKTTRHVTAVNF